MTKKNQGIQPRVASADDCHAVLNQTKDSAPNRRPIEMVKATMAHFLRGVTFRRRANNTGGTLNPKRLSNGKQPRNVSPPPTKSKNAGMMMLSVLNIQPTRIAI